MDYAAALVRSPISGKWELMSSGGKIIVFDTAAVALEWLPLLGQGRRCHTDVARATVWFEEISTTLPNIAKVVSPYSPEERTPWKRHLIWTEAFEMGG